MKYVSRWELWKSSYPKECKVIPLGRQEIPFFPGQFEDGCELITDVSTNITYLMVPGSGSAYYELSNDEINKYLK